MKSLLLLFNLVIFTIFSQNPFIFLQYNNVNAGFEQNGVLFHQSNINKSRYEIPKNFNVNTIFAASFWAGGINQLGDLHLAATKYGSGDYFSGPISLSNAYNDSMYI